ncbi:MAG: GNAT family N-acetyltransferase [Pseudolabrys sp.]|jgi:predicted N-acetyltransferase YhbS
MNYSVRRWTAPERLDELLAVVHSAFREFEPPSGVLKETLDHLTARFHNETFLVALAGNDIIGSVFCARKDDALYLTRMAVVPAWRKRGVGRALMQGAEEEARRIGMRRLTLRVRKNLPDNRAYFARFGFLVTGEGQDSGRPPYDAMERALT